MGLRWMGCFICGTGNILKGYGYHSFYAFMFVFVFPMRLSYVNKSNQY